MGSRIESDMSEWLTHQHSWLVSTIWWGESATCTHMSPPSWTSFPPTKLFIIKSNQIFEPPREQEFHFCSLHFWCAHHTYIHLYPEGGPTSISKRQAKTVTCLFYLYLTNAHALLRVLQVFVKCLAIESHKIASAQRPQRRTVKHGIWVSRPLIRSFYNFPCL